MRQPRWGAVGVQAANDGGGSAVAPLFGDCLIVLAQLAAATQFIVEEKYLAKFRVPALLAVGLEGFWGLVISGFVIVQLHNLILGCGLILEPSFRLIAVPKVGTAEDQFSIAIR